MPYATSIIWQLTYSSFVYDSYLKITYPIKYEELQIELRSLNYFGILEIDWKEIGDVPEEYAQTRKIQG